MRSRRRIQENGMVYLLAVQAATSFVQLPKKPPVTTTLIAAQTLIHLRPGKVLDACLPTLSQVCLNPYLVIKNRDLKRLFLSAFYHADETHLIYNMVSLLWKGVQLEDTMGSHKFATTVAVLLGLSQSLVVASSSLLARYTEYRTSYYSDCSVGFSGVLFALKVVLNYNAPSHTNVYGILVPSRYAAWVELVLIQMFVPGTSFLGHLCGIMAGVIYMKAPTPSRIMGALSWPMKLLWGSRRPSTFGRGSVGRRPPNRGSYVVWRCQSCTYENRGSSSVEVCEMCGTRVVVRPGSPPPPAPAVPSRRGRSFSPMSREELRQARLSRFNR